MCAGGKAIFGAVLAGISVSAELRRIGLLVDGCGVSEDGTIRSPRAPDVGNLVFFLFSV